MKRVIPYGIRVGAGGKVETVPVAHTRLRSGDGREAAVILVIDSGASVSLLSAADAETLGINLQAGERVSIRGITGHEIIGYRHAVTMVIEGFTMRAVPVVFAAHAEVPRVLGRAGVFPRFGILFDEARQRVGFLDHRTAQRVLSRA